MGLLFYEKKIKLYKKKSPTWNDLCVLNIRNKGFVFFFLGSKIMLYLGELFFKKHNFLNTLPESSRDGLLRYH